MVDYNLQFYDSLCIYGYLLFNLLTYLHISIEYTLTHSMTYVYFLSHLCTPVIVSQFLLEPAGSRWSVINGTFNYRFQIISEPPQVCFIIGHKYRNFPQLSDHGKLVRQFSILEPSSQFYGKLVRQPTRPLMYICESASTSLLLIASACRLPQYEQLKRQGVFKAKRKSRSCSSRMGVVVKCEIKERYRLPLERSK